MSEPPKSPQQQAADDAKVLHNKNAERAVRSVALDMAVRAMTSQAHDDQGRRVTNPDEVLTASDKFLKFLKGENNGT